MNYPNVLRQLGMLLLVLSATLLLVAAGAEVCELLGRSGGGTTATLSLLAGGLLAAVIGGGSVLLTRGCSRLLGRREALLLVALSWIVGAAVVATPFLIWAHIQSGVADDHPFRSAVNCYFEAMSGLTTTGATVLGAPPNDIESMPHSLLFWRAMSQWLGGIGIVVLFVAVLPSLGVGGKKLFRVEAPGPAPEGMHPQIRETARTLLYIYLGLTAAQVLLLCAAGLSLFESVSHTFTTLATGGFSTRNASTGAYGPLVYGIIVVFMILAGANFGLYYQLIRGKTRHVLRDTEMRFYLAIMIIASALVFISLLGRTIVTTAGEVLEPSRTAALVESVFTTVSIQTTTGFCTSDYNLWPFLPQAVLVLTMFIGGCSGSTAGGIKVIRLWIAFKVMLWEIERVFRPNVIRPVKIGGSTVDDALKLGTLAYVLGVIVLSLGGAGLVMLLEGGECSFTGAATASIASIFTIGPGLAEVGAVENYGFLTAASKIVLCLLMLLGRLEVFAVIVLFSPRFWRGD